MKKILLVLGSLGVSLLPTLAFAQTVGTLTSTANSAGNLISSLIGDFNLLIVLLIAVAVVAFIWYVIRYVIAGSPEKKEGAKMGMFWSVIGIAVIVLIFGLVALIGQIFGINQGGQLQSVPQLPSPSGTSGSTGGSGSTCTGMVILGLCVGGS